MNTDVRLGQILAALESVGLPSLVMGGHAVRYYGLDRNTADYDLHVAPECWEDLAPKLGQIPLFTDGILIEGPSWRPNAFRRFQIGTLPSGREEWLEFWRDNHLLAPFPELFSRREQGIYGGRVLPFLGLADLIRSKETERETDWQDIAVLEEFLDSRLLAQASAGEEALIAAIAGLRSRRGFENLLRQGHLQNLGLVRRALARATSAVTQAYLLPLAPGDLKVSPAAHSIEPPVLNRLRTETAGSSLHLALVELVRRQYKLGAQAKDKADKEAIRAAVAKASHP